MSPTLGSYPAKLSSPKTLRNAIGSALIIAYRESTDLLEQELRKAQIPYQVLRQDDRPEYKGYSSAYRCLLNHTKAWQTAARSQLPTLILEADFVPVVGMADLPLPFDPDHPKSGIAWLYTCAPQVYSVSQSGFAEGFSTALVAYVVTPRSARLLCDLAPEVRSQHGTSYSTFDSDIDSFLRARNLKNYIPFRNYGEHGGIPNPEHRLYKLSGVHRADVLYGPLAFKPAYSAIAKSTPLAFWQIRLQARLKGVLRLLMGRFVRLPVLQRSSVPGRLLSFAIRRQLSCRL